MKPCPYCAEDIRDEAIKCRYCGSDLRPGAPAIRGVAVTHVGARYLLGCELKPNGRATGRCGIVERRDLSRFVAEFPFTDEGWARAWEEFRRLEPEHRENPDPPTCPRCGQHPVRLFDPAEQAKSAVIGAAAFGLLGAVLASGGRFLCPTCGLKFGT